MRTFAQLFQGRTDAFGIYRVFEQRADGKQKGKGTTYPNDKYPDRVLEPKDWDQHLSGTQMLGIVPVLPDSTCGWFAIDVDDYSIRHKNIVVQIEKLELPLVLCRSKSGGAHLYCFINGTIDAKLAMDLGKKWAHDLGFPKAEVFPKQATPDIGNWIIVPYYGNEKALDFGVGMEGEKLSLEEFVQWANAKSINPDEAPEYLKAQEVKPGDMTDDDIIKQSPPCIQHFMKEGLPEGGRNNAMFHVGVYFQKLDEFFSTDRWSDKLAEWNATYADPSLSFGELSQIVKNLGNVGKYQYKCKDQPMCNVCDKSACIKLKFGVGEDRSFYGDMEITSMTKIDSIPPIWIPRINGVDVEMDTDTLLSPRKFRMSVADALNVLAPLMTQPKHDVLIGPIMKEALTIEPMDELTVDGKVSNSFTEWTKNMVTKSRSLSDLEKGLPYYDQEMDAIFFRGADFIKEYRRVYRDNTTERGVWAALRRSGFLRKQHRFGGSKPEWIWYYPMDEDERWFEIEIGERF